MSRYVLVSDIHGNYPALQAVVDAEGINSTYLVLGDLFGLNAYPKKTLDLIRSLDARVIIGNHDYAIFVQDEGHVNNEALSEFERSYTLESLTQEDIDWVRDQSSFDTFEDDSGNSICITHAKAWPEESRGYTSGNSGMPKGNIPHFASRVLKNRNYQYVFHGHTHEQYSLDCSRFGHDIHFVNPGTLGYKSTYAVVDTETGHVDLKSVDVDQDRITDHIQDVLPETAPSVNRWY